MIIVISPDKFPTKNEITHTIEILSILEGRYHLRIPNSSVTQIIEIIEQIPASLLTKVVLHQHFDLAKQYAVGGLHYPSYLRNDCKELIHFSKSLSVSTSFHSFEEITSNTIPFDYAFLSPIYNSISKKGYSAQFTEADLRLFLKNNKSIPALVALGGISADNMLATISMGFWGVAFLGTIWQSSDPAQMLEFLQYKMKGR